MGKVKIKRKSTLIDMTAMSDVTVLLLTFFMLTSTFLQKEPTIVYTPSSVSEEKVPVKNLVTILVSAADKGTTLPDPTVTEGKIFISFAGDSILPSEKFRGDVLMEAQKIYNEQHPKAEEQLRLTASDSAAFVKTNMMGTSFKNLKKVLEMDIVQRDKLMGDQTNKEAGIPINTNTNEDHLNDFQIWMKALRNVAQRAKDDYLKNNNIENSKENQEQIRAIEMLANSLAKGESITIKADKDTPFEIINVIFENLRFMELNKFTLMTSLKARDK